MELEGQIFIASPILDVLLGLHVFSNCLAPLLIALTGAVTQTKRGSRSAGSRLMLDPDIMSLFVQADFVVLIKNGLFNAEMN